MSDNPLFERIDNAVKEHPVLLFMKGNPSFPQCGFSSQVVQILKHLEVEFASVDVLQDNDIREGIKAYSDWPTIPQLYVGGDFVGGCDIVTEMFQTGELRSLLEEKGVCEASA